MSNIIFKPQNIVQSSFFQKLFKQIPEQNAVIELNNLLADTQIRQITTNQISEIENRYSVNLVKEFKLNLEEFYAVYLNYCLADKSLINEEIEELKHLKYILNIDDKSIDKIHSMIGETVYKQTFEEAVIDGRLTKEEESFLEKLESDLKLSKALTEKISAEVRTNYIDNYIQNLITDQRLSPNEENELNAIAASFNVKLIINEQTKEQLQKLKLYWVLENSDLPIVQTNISLQKGESCFICVPNVNWFELRAVRKSVSYSGYSTSFKVAKGFYLRSGSYKPRSYSVDQMTLIDNGTLYLTNKRIIFTGYKKNSNTKIEKILSVSPYEGGVQIDKETGKSPLLQFTDRADIFCIILERLLNEK